jgi:outer membrane lipoprotein-sorting protein
MNIRSYLPAAVMAFLVAGPMVSAQVKKYDIKSGVITFERTMKMGALTVKGKIVVSFDEYGMKECRDTYEGDVITESYFSDGKTLWILRPKKKTVVRQGDAFRGTEVRYAWDEISAKDKKEGKAKQMPKMVVAGKTCDVFQILDKSSTTTFAGWNHIVLYSDVAGKTLTSVQKAVKIEENVPVSPQKFQVPSDYTVK